MADSHATVLFDGDCGICTASAEWIERHDRVGRLTVLPYQLADLETLSPGLTPEMASRSAVFVAPGGRRWRDARAIFETLRRLPGFWGVIGWLGANPAVAALCWPFYRLVADHRAGISTRLGLTRCAVPRRGDLTPDRLSGGRRG